MALTEKDFLAAIARLKERNALQEQPVERMSIDEFRKTYENVSGVTKEETPVVKQPIADVPTTDVVTAINTLSKETVTETIKTEEIKKSVTDKNAEGLYKEADKQTKAAEETKTYQKEQLDALLKLGKSFEAVKSPLEKLAGKIQAYSPTNIKETLLSKMNIKLPGVGGIFDKAIAKERFIKTEKLLGSTKTKAEIGADFKSYNKQAKIIQKNSKVMSDIKASLPDASEQQLINNVPEYKKLKEENEVAAEESGKFTVKASVMKPTNEDVGSTTKKKKSRGVSESANESITPEPVAPIKTKPEKGQEVDFDKQKYRFLGQQWTEVNSETGKEGKIAEKGIVAHLNKLAGVDPSVNPTKKNADATATAEKTQEAQGLAKEQTELLHRIAENTGNGTVGKEPTKDNKSSFGSKLSKVADSMVGAAKGVAAIGGALVVLTLGLKAISTIDYESIIKATAAIGGLIIVSKLIGDNTGSMLKGALGIAALGAALMVAGEGFKAFSELDWEVLAKAGVAVTGLALAAAGIGAFVAPILLGAAAIAAIGASVWVLAKGIDALATSIDRVKSPKTTTGPTANIQPSTVKPASANAVYGASAENATVAGATNAGTTNNVVAPTTVNNTTNQTGGYKPDVRNQDSSFKRMLDTRYVPV